MSATKQCTMKIYFQGGKIKTGNKDVVIRASPSNPPFTLPLLCGQLQNGGMKIFTTCHVHSSVLKGIPNKLEDFLPISNCDARSKADLCITLIWKEVGKDLEVVTSPTTNSIFKGEINLLRYFSKRFNLFPVQNTKIEVQIDSILDSIHAEVNWGTGNLSRVMSASLEPSLKKAPFFATQNLSLADIYAFVLISNEKAAKMTPAIQEWMKRCQIALMNKTSGNF